MTRKDFEAIAHALNASRQCWAEHDPEDYPESARHECPEQEQWWRTVAHVADALYASNPRFNRDRFVRACTK